jgi:DNA-binding LacI/PurR family transcriptional regulator
VLAVAKRLGYQAHPLISALMSARAGRRQPVHQGTLAFVRVDDQPPPDWQHGAFSYAWMFQGACARALQRGYILKPMWLHEPGTTPEQFMDSLRARNITGVFIAPHSGSRHRVPFNWQGFSVIEFGYNLAEPQFHRVVHDYYHAMQTACAYAIKAGHRRIGLTLPQRADIKTHHLWTAAYLHFQQSLAAADRVPMYIPDHITTTGLRAWSLEHSLEAILLGGHHYPLAQHITHPFTFPKNIALISLDLREHSGPTPGIFQDWPAMGEAAADMLIDQLHRGEFGVPSQPRSLMVSGLWNDGR